MRMMKMAKKKMTAPDASDGADAERSPQTDNDIITQREKKSNSVNICTCAADVPLATVEWLWYPYIPYAKVTIIKGDPGLGKSRFALDLAARVSTGAPFPFEQNGRVPETVIYQTSEDDYQDTVIPRFIAVGGDLTRMFYINEQSNGHITFADERLRQQITLHKARLLVLDPLSSYIGDVSLNAANEVRSQFDALISLARSTGCAILVITHLTKSDGKKLIYRTPGSIDVVGAVRSELTIDVDPENSAKKYLLHSKSNLATPGACVEMIERGDGTFDYSQISNITAQQLFNSLNPIGRPADRFKEVTDIIAELLADGPRPSRECAARLNSYAGATIQAAKKYLGVQSVRDGDNWRWELPTDSIDT